MAEEHVEQLNESDEAQEAEELEGNRDGEAGGGVEVNSAGEGGCEKSGDVQENEDEDREDMEDLSESRSHKSFLSSSGSFLVKMRKSSSFSADCSSSLIRLLSSWFNRCC